jgi:hypothetical protein
MTIRLPLSSIVETFFDEASALWISTIGLPCRSQKVKGLFRILRLPLWDWCFREIPATAESSACCLEKCAITLVGLLGSPNNSLECSTKDNPEAYVLLHNSGLGSADGDHMLMWVSNREVMLSLSREGGMYTAVLREPEIRPGAITQHSIT